MKLYLLKSSLKALGSRNPFISAKTLLDLYRNSNCICGRHCC